MGSNIRDDLSDSPMDLRDDWSPSSMGSEQDHISFPGSPENSHQSDSTSQTEDMLPRGVIILQPSQPKDPETKAKYNIISRLFFL